MKSKKLAVANSRPLLIHPAKTGLLEILNPYDAAAHIEVERSSNNNREKEEIRKCQKANKD